MRPPILLLAIGLLGCGKVLETPGDGGDDASQRFNVQVVRSGTGGGTITSPAGIDCGADCSEALAAGAQITLTAVPDATSRLASWGVAGCDDAAQPCTLTVTGDTTVNAVFAKSLFSCADINDPNGFQVVIEPGKVILGPDAMHAVRCDQIDADTISIHTLAVDTLRYSNQGIFAGRGLFDQALRDRPENVTRICNHLGYPFAHGRSTSVNSSIEAVIDADLNGFQMVAAGDDWISIECSRMSKGKTCAQINDANGFQVVISPGQVVLGPDTSHAVRCQQVATDHIHIFEMSNFDTLRYANVGIFAGRPQFDQAVRSIPEQIERLCNFLGYPVATGTTTAVNSSIEALVNADMAGFTLPVAGDDWLTFDCAFQ